MPLRFTVVAKSSGKLQRLGHSNRERIRQSGKTKIIHNINICTGRSKTVDAHGSTFSVTHRSASPCVFFLGFSSGEGPLQEVKVCKTEDCQAGLGLECTRCHAHVRLYKLVAVEVLSTHVFSPWL